MIDPAVETARWHMRAEWTDVTVTADDRALVPYGVFLHMDDYSCTLPSGAFVGKRWKRHVPFGGPGYWMMGEYTDDPDPNMIGIKWREIDIQFPRNPLYGARPQPATDENINAYKASETL